MRTWLPSLGILLLCTAAASAGKTLTYTDLVGRLTDLEGLARLPEPGERCDQWSSYDRRSKVDATTGAYVEWAANGDGTGFIRTEGDQQVFAEMTGPGCIWRIWSARPEAGRVKIYLDGADTPAVDLPFIDYFNRKNTPFVYPSLVHMTGRGQNCYVPIPYQKSCKIVAEKGWGRYFLIDYATYPTGTKVPTFRRGLSSLETAALEKADAFLSRRLGTDPAGTREGRQTQTKKLTLGAGKSIEAFSIAGPRAITALKVRSNIGNLPDRRQQFDALRELVLRITWDDEDRPAVWCPLGDFFGTTAGVNLYKSLPLGMTENEFYCFWYMPFATCATIELVNDGKTDRELEVDVTHAPLSQPASQLGRFHAKWHRDALLPKDAERAKIDWTLLTTRGRGRFVGTMLHIWNPRGRWWGEGDEKFFVDGEKFPSWFGTGSEDYFGYAWCCPDLFQNCYHNQTISNGNKGHISVNRWHITDNVPFQKSFEGCIEKYFRNERPTLYANVSYWYLASGGTDPYGEATLAERTGYFVEPEIFRVAGAIEGERLRPLDVTGGSTRVQALTSFGKNAWSEDAQLWWTQGKVGSKLTLPVRTPAEGTFELTCQLTKAVDYAIVQFHLDGAKVGGPIDLYNPRVIPTGELSLGTFDLTRGVHKLTVEIVGANPKAKKAYMFGLDYLKLIPAK